MKGHIFFALLLLAASSCLAATPDGSSKAKAIPLQQRDPAKAVEEEMQWMMKLYHYTPLLAMRDAIRGALPDIVRKAKAGKKAASVDPGWEHATVEHNGHLISDWRFQTTRGKRDVYFDTGTLINAPGEVARQESARGQYMVRKMQTFKV